MILNTNNFIEQKFLDNIKFFLLLIGLLASVIQLYINTFSLNTIIILIIINLSIIFVCKISLIKENLIQNLFGCLILILINFYYLSGPLIIKTFLMQSIVDRLDLPFKSFLISFCMQLSFILSFLLIKVPNYKDKTINYRNKITYKFRAFNYFNYRKTLIIFIIIVFVKTYLSLFDSGFNSYSEYGNIFLKFLYGVSEFFYIPLILIFNIYYNDKTITKKLFIFFIFLNLLLPFLYMFLINSRGELIIAFYNILLIFMIKFIFDKDKVNKKTMLYLIGCIVIFFLVFNKFSNVILEKRSDRTNETPLNLLISSFVEMNIIENYEMEYNSPENYTGNMVLNRFLGIKYLDKTLIETSYYSLVEKKKFQDFSIKKMLSFLPQNFISFFNSDYRKSDYALSIGSYIERSIGVNYGGGAYAKGSFITELLLLTDSYILSFFIMVIIFYISLKIIISFQILKDKEIIYSPLIMIMGSDIIYLVSSGGLLFFINQIIRTPIQIILIYYLINLITLNKTQNIY